MAKVKRKIEEVLGLTQDRRERSTVYNDLSLADKAPDPFLRALQEADEVVIAPPEAEAEPAPPEPTLPPETPPEVGAEELMKPPEPEPTGDVEEEKKRALFNTLTELIDLGRIERNEADIRKYAGDHEDELGELAESLDTVIEMLVMDAEILRTPQTFDVEASPSDAEKKQAKPGVGPAVQISGPEGILQASDQSKGKGKPVMDAVDRILAGEDVLEVLKEEVRTATISNGRGDREIVVGVTGPARRRGKYFDPAGEAERVLREALGGVANVKRATAASVTVAFKGDRRKVVDATKRALEEARYSVTDKTTAEPGRLARAGRAIKRGLARVTPGVLVAQAQESVTEQMDIARVGVAVEIRFSDKKEAQATKGALLQYKGIDSVEETTDNTLVAFTTDEDVEEARNRVTTILQNARIPIESVQIEHFEPLVEGIQATMWTAYNGPDVMPAPVPVAHGMSGADEAEDEDARSEQYAGMLNWAYEWLQPYKERPGEESHHLSRALQQEFNLTQQEADGVTSDAIERFQQLEQAEEPELDTGEAPGDEGKYLRPYFEPDGEEMPPEEEVEGTLWRMDVPEDPSEFDSLAEVLNRAKDAGLIVSWVRVSPGEEEMPPEEPEGEVLDMRPEAAVGIDYGSGLASVGEAREEQAPEELPPVADLEPDDTPVDELPPEEVPPEEEPEKEYIAVEFAPEVDQEEMEGFPEWVAAETEDPETGEGVVTVLGWEPAGEEPEAELPPDEELPPEDDEFLMPDEEPELEKQCVKGKALLGVGEGAQLKALHSEGYYFEIETDSEDEARAFETHAAGKRGVRVESVRGTRVWGMVDVDSEETAEKALRLVAGRADLDLTEEDLDEQGAEYQQYLQTQKELRHAVKHAAKGEPKTRVTPRMWRAAAKKPAGPELPPDVQMLVKDYKAAMSAGDEEMARRIRGELEFELQTLGIDPKAVLGG